MPGTVLQWDIIDGAPLATLQGIDGATLAFDIVSKEDVTYKSTKTNKPVEAGVEITDHVRRELTPIVLEVYVSNSPLGVANKIDALQPRGTVASLPINTSTPASLSLFGKIQAALAIAETAVFDPVAFVLAAQQAPKPLFAQILRFFQPFNAAKDTINILRQLKDNAIPVKVISDLWYEENQIITSINVPRDFETGDGAIITIELEELRIVQTRTATVPIDLRASAPKAVGVAGDKPAADDKLRSAARTLASMAGVLP